MRLKGGKLLLDLTDYGNFTNVGVSLRQKEIDIISSFTNYKNGSYGDLPKPILVKFLYNSGYLCYGEIISISDDKLDIVGLSFVGGTIIDIDIDSDFVFKLTPHGLA